MKQFKFFIILNWCWQSPTDLTMGKYLLKFSHHIDMHIFIFLPKLDISVWCEVQIFYRIFPLSLVFDVCSFFIALCCMLLLFDSRASPGRELSPDPNLPHIGPRFPPAGRYYTITSICTNNSSTRFNHFIHYYINSLCWIYMFSIIFIKLLQSM